MVHLLKNSKLVFATVLLGFQVQLLSAPTFSSGHGEGIKIIQKPQEESEVVEPMNPEKRLEELVGEFEEKIRETLNNTQGDVEQIDTLLEEAKEKMGQIEKTLTDAQTDAEKIKETLTKPVEQIEKTLTNTREKVGNTEEDIKNLESKVSKIQNQIEIFIVLGSFGGYLLINLFSFIFKPLLKFLQRNQKIDEKQKELEDRIKDLESKFSKIQDRIKTIIIFGSITVLVLIVILSSPTELLPESLESRLNQRIDELEDKIENQ